MSKLDRALIGGVRVPTSVGFFTLPEKSPTKVGTLTPLGHYSKVFAAALIISAAAIVAYGQSQRRAAGIIYFTNNTPKDLRTFPVEILKAGHKKVAVTFADEQHRFAFANLKPGKYLLRLTWPKHCVLSYRLDLRTQSKERIEVIMDAECAHHNGEVRELPSN